MTLRPCLLGIAIWGVSSALLAAADPVPAPELLSIDRIFQGDEFQEERQSTRVFSRRSPAWFSLQTPVDPPADDKKNGKETGKKRPGRDLVRTDLETGKNDVIVPAMRLVPTGADAPLEVEGFEFSADENRILISTKTQRVWRRNTRGDYWVYDRSNDSLRKLGGDAPPSTLQFAKFSPDASQVAYVRQNNIYLQDLQTLSIRPLTLDGSARIVNGTGDWVNEEELEIRDGFRWSPDGRQIAYWQFDTTGVADFTLIDNTSGTHARTQSFAYPKVGGINSAARVGVVEVASSVTRWLDIPGDPRNHYIARVEWIPDGGHVLLHQFNRLQNTLHIWMADPRTGTVERVFTESDEAWIENENPVTWLAGGKRLLWLSERSGWRQAYTLGQDGHLSSPLTPAETDVLKIEAVVESTGDVYFTASPDNPTQCYLYRVSLNGGPAARLTPVDQPGWHSYAIAPDGKFAFHTYSTLTRPPSVDLVRLSDHSVVRSVVKNSRLHESVARLTLPKAEFLRLPVADGVELDAWTLPPTGSRPSSPLVIYVYGEPHGQTVRDAWQGPRGLWHLMLAQQGYRVASIDNRGTMSPRGRAWRKCVYRQVGILASQDQSAALKALLQRFPDIDPHRVGVWGWSGGGSMTLNLAFRHPDLYATAISVAPVPDQTLYDTIYQERYMGLPDNNADGYRAGSPITHAQNLRANLLLIHGTGDDNCHYQGTERLMNVLIEHNKVFSALPYPGRSHSVSEGPNTTRHLYTLMTHYFNNHLGTSGSVPSTAP